MKKVLILTAGFGDGHNTAARNLSEAIETTAPGTRVEVIDLFERCYGALNTVAKEAYLGLVQYAPAVWGSLYWLLDKSTWVERQCGRLSRVQGALANLLDECQPDCVVTTYPVYNQAIDSLFRDHARPFRLVTVVTDSITINSAWLQGHSDAYCVANEATATALKLRGISPSVVKPVGFPVSPLFAQPRSAELDAPTSGGLCKLLYLINTGKRKKALKTIRRLLEMPDTQITVVVGRHPKFRARLIEEFSKVGDRLHVLGWTNQMPQLLMTHHLLISKAGGATVQEAIAARCPMIINQVIPGQEGGNARLVQDSGLGALAEKSKDVVRWVERAFLHKARLWRRWRENLAIASKPDAALQIAQMVLAECDRGENGHEVETIRPALLSRPCVVIPRSRENPRPLLCDFHMHSTYSDGRLSISELVDFYGARGFDCICVTDHLADPQRLIGRLGRLAHLTLRDHQLGEYFAALEREKRRAWNRYKMLVMGGLEINKDGLTPKSSAHLLGIGLESPLNPRQDLPEIIAHIHAQGGLAVASHPHIMKSEWGKDTLYLWENLDTFIPLLDAWEVANRNNVFNPVSSRRLPYLASSDFHKPKHIYSWKTILYCEKEPEAIKACIRENERVAITLYRDSQPLIPVLGHQTSPEGVRVAVSDLLVATPNRSSRE